MQKIKVKLETVTPLFLGGAESRGEPELRPPAFRGAMRYWLRAVLGAGISDDPDRIKEIKKREAEVFGGAGEESGASAVNVRISYDEEPAIGVYSGDKPRRDTINGKPVIRPTGRDYLYWSMKKTNDEPAHQYFLPATSFDIVLSSRLGTSKTAFEMAIKALWLLIHLGGVGSRSRRTGGSLSVTNPFQENELSFSLTSGKLAKQELSDGLKIILGESSTARNLSGYDVLASGACSVWLLKGEPKWTSWEEAVKEIGEKMCDARTYSKPDKQNVIKWIGGEEIDTVQRSIFGLPLTFKYSNGKSGTVQGKELDRRASPLWLKVSRAINGDYVGVATLFKSAFLPAGEKLHLKTSRLNPPPIKPPPDYALIENWLKDDLKAEVVYE